VRLNEEKTRNDNGTKIPSQDVQILDGALVPGAVNQIAAQIKLTEIWNASYGLQYPVKI
jgi:hypothetical protein